MNFNRVWWTLIPTIATLSTPIPGIANGAQQDPHETAIDELYWAIHACEEGLQPDTTPVRRQQLLEDYRFRRTRAVRLDPSVQNLPRTKQYATREWLRRCDSVLPRLVQQGKKQAAEAEASAALQSCKAAVTRGTTEQAESDLQAFKTKKANALKLDPSLEKTKLGQELVACDKQVTDFIQGRKSVEAEAMRRYREDAKLVVAKPSPATARPTLAEAETKR